MTRIRITLSTLFAPGVLLIVALPAVAIELSGRATAPEEPLSLWYRQPAKEWVEALPVGNGRHGVMVFGGIETQTACRHALPFLCSQA